ncbi:MAG: A/G-specific adenine glycosylase [Bdellovibrionaceae bacterium]|nr:A/G-specific adenine glycosylase [Pseudobdellovibrionaceae bacterium]
MKSNSANYLAEIKNDSLALAAWYKTNQRKLPWRESKNPYYIWISEVMLQQTTVAAVMPYFERFITRFPTLSQLADAPLDHVLEMWSGLGYYSRARNLHKAAQSLNAVPFPITHQELIKFPGLGPYTARAVTSIAFGDRAGVVDGNVIRVLCRRWGLKLEWWKNKEKDKLQIIADDLVQHGDPSMVNQGLMELGATVCSREKPICGLCPWNKSCLAFKTNQVAELPLRKPKKEKSLWLYNPEIVQKNSQILLAKNLAIPVLSRMWMIPGTVQKITKKPSAYDFTHSVTDHIIYVVSQRPSPRRHSTSIISKKDIDHLKWIPISDIGKYSQSSLTKKLLKKWDL